MIYAHVYRVLVCGGRTYSNYPKLKDTLDKLLLCTKFRKQELVIIQGEARGADLLSKQWALENEIQHLSFPANWETYGKKAGSIRNKQMLVEGKPDLVIGFSGGIGTAHMIRISKEANIMVLEVKGT